MFQERHPRNSGSAGVCAKDSMVLNAPANLVWNLLLDVQSWDQLFRGCSGIKNLNKKRAIHPVEPGAKWLEQRRMGENELDLIVSATTVDATQRVFAVATTLYQSTGTCTHTVESLSNDSCRLSISYGMVPNGWYGRLYIWIFRRRF